MDNKRFLTHKETAAYLDITEHSLYLLTSQRKITYYQCSKRNYFDIEDIYAYIMRTKIPAKSGKAGRRGKRGKEEGTQETEKRVECLYGEVEASAGTENGDGHRPVVYGSRNK